MRQEALAERTGDDSNGVSGPYALAVEPDVVQAEALERMLGERIGGRLKVVGSTDEAFAALTERIPDLILMSPFLAPLDEEKIVVRLASFGADASHVQLLSIPRVSDKQPPVEKKRRFGWQQQKPASGGGFDPIAFANEVAAYLAHASALRRQTRTVGPPEPDADDSLAGLRIEHIEQLLERLDADPPPQAIAGPSPIPEREFMVTTTTPELNVAPRNAADTRLPRFLILDDQVPQPLRALLDEADGCLKMSFMTGAGACVERALDLLLSEQGTGEGDRAEQILQLGKKHPAVSESFLRGLSLVTSSRSGAWDEARATLAIAILKAIAYEIYVLGPERKERAAYVIDLLGRYKAAGKA
jgi:hypothetical protein